MAAPGPAPVVNAMSPALAPSSCASDERTRSDVSKKLAASPPTGRPFNAADAQAAATAIRGMAACPAKFRKVAPARSAQAVAARSMSAGL